MGRKSNTQPFFPGRKAMLKTTDGKVAFIRRGRQMKVQEVQELNAKAKSVTVFFRTGEGKSVYMAFRFQQQGQYYFLVVKNDKLKVLKRQLSCSNEFFFKWGEESGKGRSLVSVAAPQVYLSAVDSVGTVGAACASTPPLLFDLEWLE